MSETTHRAIDVRRQHRMSFGETWTLCIHGVKHRLLRSMLTLAVVVLAVAFFMFLLSESMFQRSVGRGVAAEDAAARAAQTHLSRVVERANDLVSVRRLAAAWDATDEPALAEAAAVSGLAPDEIRFLAETAARETVYTEWLAGLPIGKRLVLVGKNLGRPAFAAMLADEEEFFLQLSRMVDIRVPGERKADSLREFLGGFRDYEKRLAAFTAAWNAAVDKARAATDKAAGGRSDYERWIPDAPEADTEAWRTAVAALGFRFEPADLSTMRSQFRDINLADDVMDTLSGAEFRAEWAKKFRETTTTTAEEKLRQLGDPRARELLAGSFDGPQLDAVVARHAREARLAVLRERLAPVFSSKPDLLGLTNRQLFLLAISFLVCMVGIANAMLMSITERYREIATMKCLGATDGYILSQFMMEAALQGFFGGLVGVLVGFVISTVRCALLYGSHLWAYFPGADIAVCSLFSLVVGVLLAALASIQPSWAASRMAPMEAMRVE